MRISLPKSVRACFWCYWGVLGARARRDYDFRLFSKGLATMK